MHSFRKGVHVHVAVWGWAEFSSLLRPQPLVFQIIDNNILIGYTKLDLPFKKFDDFKLRFLCCVNIRSLLFMFKIVHLFTQTQSHCRQHIWKPILLVPHNKHKLKSICRIILLEFCGCNILNYDSAIVIHCRLNFNSKQIFDTPLAALIALCTANEHPKVNPTLLTLSVAHVLMYLPKQ